MVSYDIRSIMTCHIQLNICGVICGGDMPCQCTCHVMSSHAIILLYIPCDLMECHATCSLLHTTTHSAYGGPHAEYEEQRTVPGPYDTTLHAGKS